MPTSTNSNGPILLFMDFDSTLTTKSTLPLIASISSYPEPNPLLGPLSLEYSKALADHEAEYRPPASERGTLKQELAYLGSLDKVEGDSVDRVQACGIFQDVTDNDVDGVARACVRDGTISLRKGWAELIRFVQRENRDQECAEGEVSIISVAWSARFIRAVILEAAKASKVEMEEVIVHANQIDPHGSGEVLGCASLPRRSRLMTARHKAEVMSTVVADFSKRKGPAKTVYCGDSTTDLECLMTADIGICIRDSIMTTEQRELQDTLIRLGVTAWLLKPVADDGKLKVFNEKTIGGARECDSEEGTSIRGAKNFEEVLEDGLTISYGRDWS